MKFGRQMMPLKMASKPFFFNLVASAIPKWRIFKLLKWMQRNLIPIGGFG
jgi:hypothetical protein